VRKSNEVLPDTNVLLRYLLRDNPGQFHVAEEFFEKVRTGKAKARILEGVLLECIYVMTKYYQVPRAEVSAALIGLLHYKGITNQDKDIFEYALNNWPRQHSIRWTACCLLSGKNRTCKL
jgi:predicted nucleic-acid-binding protein